MKVLSLFDGMSCGQLALKRAGIPYKDYYASEIDPYAMKVCNHNFPNTIQLGDVTKLCVDSLPKIDLLLAGSPCQGLSVAGKHLGLDDPRSALFYNFVDILHRVKPKYFLLENVRVNDETLKIMNDALNCIPMFIDSKHFSGAMRSRYYWTNISIDTLKPNDVSFQSCLESDEARIPKAYALTATYYKKGGEATRQRNFQKSQRPIAWIDDDNTRWLTPLECERLMEVPENYTDCVSNTQRYKMLGNGWTISVVSAILANIKED